MEDNPRAPMEENGLAPNDHESLQSLAKELYSQGKRDEAIAALSQSVAIEPDDCVAWFDQALPSLGEGRAW